MMGAWPDCPSPLGSANCWRKGWTAMTANIWNTADAYIDAVNTQQCCCCRRYAYQNLVLAAARAFINCWTWCLWYKYALLQFVLIESAVCMRVFSDSHISSRHCVRVQFSDAAMPCTAGMSNILSRLVYKTSIGWLYFIIIWHLLTLFGFYNTSFIPTCAQAYAK